MIVIPTVVYCHKWPLFQIVLYKTFFLCFQLMTNPCDYLPSIKFLELVRINVKSNQRDKLGHFSAKSACSIQMIYIFIFCHDFYLSLIILKVPSL